MQSRLVLAATALCVAAGAVGGATAAAAPLGGGYRCAPTETDGFGPFSRVAPPRRATIGRGHVLTGVVLSALTCKPVKGAQMWFWQAGRNGRYSAAGSGWTLTDASGR